MIIIVPGSPIALASGTTGQLLLAVGSTGSCWSFLEAEQYAAALLLASLLQQDLMLAPTQSEGWIHVSQSDRAGGFTPFSASNHPCSSQALHNSVQVLCVLCVVNAAGSAAGRRLRGVPNLEMFNLIPCWLFPSAYLAYRSFGGTHDDRQPYLPEDS